MASRNMIEHYYRSVLFHFHEWFALLPSFRLTDQWKVGVLPADIIMNIAVDVLCHRHNFNGLDPKSSDNSINGWWGGRQYWDRSRKETLGFLLELEHIFGFAPGTKVTISVISGSHKTGTPIYIQE
jgi:hypothetical protein